MTDGSREAPSAGSGGVENRERGGSPEIRVSFADILAGRAYLRIPFVGKLLLAHWAGAPWSEKNPDAHIHGLQAETVAHREMTKVVHGGSGLGKSVLGGIEGICEAVIPRARLAVVAHRYDHVGSEWQYIHAGLRSLFPKQAFKSLVYIDRGNYHNYNFETIWDSTGRGFSVDADEGAALLGKEFTRVIVGEGSHVSVYVYENRILRATDRARMSRPGLEVGFLTCYTTPKEYSGCSAHIVERARKATRQRLEALEYGEVPFPETLWFREADVLENPAYDRASYYARKRTLSPEAFEETYGGKMTHRSGRVLRSFAESQHVTARASAAEIRTMRLAVGIDTGAYTALSLVGILPTNRYHVLGSLQTRGLPIDETLDEFRQLATDILAPAAGTTDFDRIRDSLLELWVPDPASQHKLEIMANLDVTLSPPIGIPEGGKLELIPSITFIDGLFAQNQITIADSNEELIDQIRGYVWKTVRAGQRTGKGPVLKEPTKEHDHIIDATRFAICGLFHMGPREEAPPPATFVQAWESAQRDMIFGPLRRALERGGSTPGGLPV